MSEPTITLREGRVVLSRSTFEVELEPHEARQVCALMKDADLELTGGTGGWRVKRCVTEGEREGLISDAARAVEVFGEDELEAYASSMRREQG